MSALVDLCSIIMLRFTMIGQKPCDFSPSHIFKKLSLNIIQGSCVIIFWAYMHTRLHTRKILCIHKKLTKSWCSKTVFMTKIGDFNSEKCSKTVNQCRNFCCVLAKIFSTQHTTQKTRKSCVNTHTYMKNRNPDIIIKDFKGGRFFDDFDSNSLAHANLGWKWSKGSYQNTD